ncbi:DMT family transporter [Dinoroseobacter sp. S124A]|uniref:DMT family transporter n=1 Tax=Dinoroseobacter sp. S124A TaxID=3415128 RepID=UPI003C7A189E
MFQDLRPALILVLAPLLWAGNFVAARAVHALSDPVWLNAARWSLAALCLAPVLWRDRVAVRAALRRDLARLCGLALLGVIGTNTVLYAGLEHASAKQAGVIYAVSPLMILGLSWALGRAGLCRGTVLGSGLAFGGAVLVVTGGDLAGLTLGAGRGALLVLASAGIWAGYTVALQAWRIPLSPLSLLGVQAVLGALAVLPFLLSPASMPAGAAGPVMGAVLYLGLGASILAFWIWARAIERLGAARAGIFLQLIPVFGAVLAVVLLDERPTQWQVAGMVCAVAGVALAAQPGLGSARDPCQKAGAKEGSPHAPRDHHPQDR